MATYDIDLLRAVFVDKLNDSSIFLASFYEQIEDEQSVSRYVQNIKDMIALQNREKSVSNYKAMGIISQAGSAEILNIKSNYISPLEYQVRLDIELSDRDYVVDKIKTLIMNTKGRKFDTALRTNGEYVIFNEFQTYNELHALPVLFNRAYFPYTGSDPATASNYIAHMKTRFVLTKNTQNVDLTTYYVYNNTTFFRTVYKHTGWSITSSTLSAYNATTEKVEVNMDNTADLISEQNIFLNAVGRTHRGVLKINDLQALTTTYYAISLGTETAVNTNFGGVPQFFKLSLSFNGIQSDEPFLNNGLDRVFVFFGGSATIVKDNVSFGNDIVRTTIQAGKDTGTIYEVEPLEIPASLNINDDGYSVYANGFRSVDRNMAIQNKLSYSFVFDYNNALYRDLYRLSRYGANANTYTNLVFTITEYRYSMGILVVDKFYAKLGDGGVQNTNGDVITLNVSFKVGAY